MADMAGFRCETERLILRDWQASDAADFHRLHCDPKVMRTLGPVRDLRYTTDLIVDLSERARRNGGFTYWAAELRENGRVIGFCGLDRGHEEPIMGELEIGWRLASDCWGRGYATEAARACLAWANANLTDERCVAITAKINARSRRVMERIGMVYRPELDFDHPGVAPDSELRPHVTYTKGAPL
ncbi:MAG: GNAT family N-acetyltransferase [Erythrobacter sp.]|nr:GNAT family N-acetyltransferase [Erythrobacter sp.]